MGKTHKDQSLKYPLKKDVRREQIEVPEEWQILHPEEKEDEFFGIESNDDWFDEDLTP